jgi:hypothetical protein
VKTLTTIIIVLGCLVVGEYIFFKAQLIDYRNRWELADRLRPMNNVMAERNALLAETMRKYFAGEVTRDSVLSISDYCQSYIAEMQDTVDVMKREITTNSEGQK